MFDCLVFYTKSQKLWESLTDKMLVIHTHLCGDHQGCYMVYKMQTFKHLSWVLHIVLQISNFSTLSKPDLKHDLKYNTKSIYKLPLPFTWSPLPVKNLNNKPLHFSSQALPFSPFLLSRNSVNSLSEKSSNRHIDLETMEENPSNNRTKTARYIRPTLIIMKHKKHVLHIQNIYNKGLSY